MNEKKSKEDLKNNAAFSKKVAEKIFITIRDTTFRNMFAPFSEKVSEKDVSRKISIAHFASAPFFRKGARKRGFGLLRKLRKMFLHLFFEKVQPKRGVGILRKPRKMFLHLFSKRCNQKDKGAGHFRLCPAPLNPTPQLLRVSP